MKTTINFGKIAYSGKDKNNLVTVEIELKNKPTAREYETFKEVSNVPELSICGNVWDSRHYDLEMCGQCINQLTELIPNNKKLTRIREIWEQYHCNGLTAGSKKQTEYLQQFKKELNEYYKHGFSSYYDYECDLLAKAGLLYDSGYKFGSAWLYKPIPENVIKEIQELIKPA